MTCRGADLEQIVNEAAIRTVRRVSVHLKDGVPTTEVDVSILPEDIEESIKSFFQARSEKKSEDGLLFGRQSSSIITLPKL